MAAISRPRGRDLSLFRELGPSGAFVLIGILLALPLIVLVDWGSRFGPTDSSATRSGRLVRSSWAKGEPDLSAIAPMGRIQRITIHHSGVRFRTVERSATARRLENIRRYHRDEKGWADIAYHYVVDRAGRQWEGRDLDKQGAHAGSFELNRGNIGVMLLGDFEAQEPSEAQLDGLEDLLDELLDAHELDRSHVFWHRELRATACPGEVLVAWLEKWRRGR